MSESKMPSMDIQIRKTATQMKIVLIDASCFFYKAFFGNPADPVATLRTMINSALRYHNPDRVVAALDAGRETFRNKIYPAYKGNRPPSPEGYSEILPAMKAALSDLGCESIAVHGYESDDILGTLCAQHVGAERIIMSIDKDLMQLVKDRPFSISANHSVTMWDGRWIEEQQVWEKFGVVPPLVVDVLALIGDKTDNIPGVAGIGEKTAIKLIQQFGSLDILFDRLKEVAPPRIRALLEHGRESAFLSRQLATINCNVPLN